MSAQPPAPTVSPRLSFKGWLFSVWLCKNKAYIKKVLAPVSVLAAGGAFDAAVLKYTSVAVAFGVLTIVAKLGWDAFDYYVSDGPR